MPADFQRLSRLLSLSAEARVITNIGNSDTDFLADGGMTIANGGGILIGNPTALTTSNGDGATNLIPELQVQGTGKADSALLLAAFSTTATRAAAASVNLVKGGASSISVGTVVTDNEILGGIYAFGDDGTDIESPAGAIEFEVDGTPGTGQMPGAMVFYTTPSGSETLTERMRINAAGDTLFTGNTLAANAAGPALYNRAATSTVPTLIPNKADPDTGVGWVGTNNLALVANGAKVLDATDGRVQFGDNAAGSQAMNEAATSTNPTLVPNRADTDTGVGWKSSDVGALVAGGVEIAEWTTNQIEIFGAAAAGATLRLTSLDTTLLDQDLLGQILWESGDTNVAGTTAGQIIVRAGRNVTGTGDDDYEMNFEVSGLEFMRIDAHSGAISLNPTNAGTYNQTNIYKSAYMYSGVFNQDQGADVASTNTLDVGSDGNCFEITGTTQINTLNDGSFQNGTVITLLFTSTPTVKHGESTSGANNTILLAGAADFVASAGDTLTLLLCEIDGTQAWREVSRAVI
jgi:hypothetical protein